MNPLVHLTQLSSVDLKAEFLLWLWQEDELTFNELTIHPLGAFGRAYGQDVKRIWTEEASGENEKPHLHIEVNRDGLYDALPEGLFHQPTRRKPNRSTLEIIEEIRIQQGKEAAARKFFLPLEQEFYRLRVMLTGEEQKQYSQSLHSVLNQSLIDFWEIPDFFDARQVHYLFYILPLMHRIVHDPVAVQQSFQLFTNNYVTIQTNYEPSVEIDPDLLPMVGNIVLGIDAIVGGLYPEQVATTEICITLEDESQVVDYLPDGKQWRILHYLADYLLPCETEKSIRVEVKSPNHHWWLTSDQSTGILGYTSVLA
jgi:hypothetical protein